jgi:hypothetical protein
MTLPTAMTAEPKPMEMTLRSLGGLMRQERGKERSFVFGVANGSNRPFADLPY